MIAPARRRRNDAAWRRCTSSHCFARCGTQKAERRRSATNIIHRDDMLENPWAWEMSKMWSATLREVRAVACI